MTKLITFESWVTRWDWYLYAQKNPHLVPILLVDRSPCCDPFFDPYAPSPKERRPLISGLCRRLKNFDQGDRFIYITRVDPKVYRCFGHELPDRQPRYFGVAALIVDKVWESHSLAAESFHPRRYVVNPFPTSYPPNLAHHCQPVAAVTRKSCIVYDNKRNAYTPLKSSDNLWRHQYNTYCKRQKKSSLRVAECRIEHVEGMEALKLTSQESPVFTTTDWGDKRINIMGR